MNKYRIILLILALAGLIIASNVFAQQVPMFSQYMFDRYYYNPAYAGSKARTLEVGTSHRRQYWGFDNSPISNTLYAHSQVGYSKWSVGGRFISDYIKPVYMQGLWGSATYRMSLSNNSNSYLAIGGEFGTIGRRTNLADLKLTTDLRNESDATLRYADAPINILPDIGLGVYYHTNTFFAGMAVKHLAPFRYGNNSYERSAYATLKRHYFIAGGGNIELSPDLVLTSSTLLKLLENAEFQIDITVGAIYKEVFFFGASYRTDQSVVPYIGLKLLQQLHFVYSYDYHAGNLGRYNNGSHEITLRWTKPLKEPIRRDVVDPRYYRY